MEYCLRYVFTDREYAKIVALLAHRPSTPSPAPASASPRSATRSPLRAEEIRPFVRLFVKVWAGAALINRTLLRKRSPPKPISMAALLVLCAASYRYTFRQLQRPAVSGAVAGLILALGLPSEAAAYLALYFATKIGEWGYNYADDHKWLEWKPRMLGTWVLFPLAFSQLFYSLFLHPEQTPAGFKRLMVLLSGGALTPRVPGQSMVVLRHLDEDQVLAGISRVTRDGFPAFHSPMLYARSNAGPGDILASTVPSILVPPLGGVAELLLTAHPGNKSVLGALIHPGLDSDARFWSQTLVTNVHTIGKYLVPLYLLRAAYGSRCWRGELMTAIRTTLAYALIATSAFSGIQLSRYWLGAKTPAALRFRLIGLFSGLWSVLIQGTGHAQFLYATRLAALSGIPQRSRRLVGHILLPLTLALSATMINRHPTAVSQRFYLNLANWLQTGKWESPSPQPDRSEDLK